MSPARRIARKPDSERLLRYHETGIDSKELSKDKQSKNEKPRKYRKKLSLINWLRSVKIGRAGTLALITLGVLLLAVMFITEPWVAPLNTDYVEPVEYEALESAKISVGERYSFGLELSEYEEIRDIHIDDTDILEEVGGGVRALGEYYKTRVRFAVAESKLPPKQYAHTIRLGLSDLSPAYDALRSRLRAFFGIEQIKPERTALRTLHLYEQYITVSGLENATQAQPVITLESGDRETVELVLLSGEDYEISSSNESVVYVYEYSEEPGVFTIEAANSGEATLTAVIGYWKNVDADVYADYLASAPEQPNLASGVSHENAIYVRTKAVAYPFTVSEE